MKLTVLIAGFGAMAAVSAAFIAYGKLGGKVDSAVPAATDRVIAAAGRVEPVSEEIKIASELAGRLSEVRIEDGDRIRRGQVIAVLENADYRARLALAEAQLHAREADLLRVVNGAREQERREAL